MKLSPSQTRPSALIMLACLGVAVSAGPVFAAPPASTDPSITNLKTNVLQKDGSYLWQYQVTSGTRPSLSHLVFGFDSPFTPVIKSASESNYSFVTSDPATGARGIKFDNSYTDGQVRLVSFYLTQSYTPTTQTVTFKSGQNVTTQTVKLALTAVPEPSTLGLLAFTPLAIGIVRRRRAK